MGIVKMAAWGALVCLLAVSWVAALPTPTEVVFPEDGRDGVGRNGRIVSGWEAKDGDIPYQLNIRMVSRAGGVNSCGATLIHNEWALTAAHCTHDRVTIVVRAGGVSLIRPAVIFETTKYFNHPEYNVNSPFVQPNDVALLSLERFLEYTPFIQPIRLASSFDKDKNYSGQRLQASGWGRTWTNGIAPVVLNWVYLRGVSNQFCRSAYGGSSIIVPSTICASGYNVTSQSTCQGDSGGPLVVEDVDGSISQVGISSFVSITGCHTDYPAGFARPAYYHGWFTEVTGLNFDWDPTEAPTTAAPEEDGDDSTTDGPEEGEGTSVAPEEDGDGTTVAPEEDGDGTTVAPEEDGDGTTVAPEEDGEGTTVDPEEELESEEDKDGESEEGEDDSEEDEDGESEEGEDDSEEDDESENEGKSESENGVYHEEEYY